MFALAFKYRPDVSAAYPSLSLSIIGRRKPTNRVAILVNRKDGMSVPASNVASAMQVPHRYPLHPLGLSHVHPLVPLLPFVVGDVSFEELAQITGLSAAKLNSHLTMLELRGIIEKAPGGLYRAYTQIG